MGDLELGLGRVWLGLAQGGGARLGSAKDVKVITVAALSSILSLEHLLGRYQ